MGEKQIPGTSVARRLPWSVLGLCGLLLLIVALLWPGMQAPPFSDDLAQAAKCSRFNSWTEIFQRDVFGYYRPMKNAIFALAATVQQRPVAWHMIGVVAYLAATIGVFRISSICLKHAPSAWFATAIWALSPTCVSSAIWLSCANICVGLAITAVVFDAHERAAAKGSLAWLALALIAFGLSLLCYESFLVVPALLLLRDVQRCGFRLQRRGVVGFALYAAVALAFLAVRAGASAKLSGTESLHAAFSPDTRAIHLSLSAPWFLWRHFLMWLFPFGKIEILGSYVWLKSAPASALVLAWVFLAALLGAVAMLWKRLPVVAYGLLFFVVASVPSGNFLPTFSGPIYDAYLTVPSVGLALAIASLCRTLAGSAMRKARDHRAAAGAMFAIIMIIALLRLPMCGAYFRYWAAIWSEPVKLLLLVSETRPGQFLAKGFASNLLLAEGHTEAAGQMAAEALIEAPWNHNASQTLARIHGMRGEFAQQEQILRDILRSTGRRQAIHGIARVELADCILRDPARRDEAADHYGEALAIPHLPPSLEVHCALTLAAIRETQGRKAEAREVLQRTASRQPDEPAIRQAIERLK